MRFPLETMTETPGSTDPPSSRTTPARRAVPPLRAAAWICGVSPGPAETATVGRVANSGADSGWRNACGAPATSDSSTLSQSAALTLSTSAHPCSVGGRSPGDAKISRYVVFQTAASPT
jgi:hypothetical protein